MVSTRANATISADTTGGAYTSLNGPVLNEGSGRDISPGTFTLNAPAGFAFNPGAAVTVTVTKTAGNGNPLTLSSANAVVSASSISITITSTDSTGSTKSRLTWSGIQVRPAAGTPLASGDIVASGTATVVGVSSSTSFGTLTETGGSVVGLSIATQPGNAVAGAPFGTQPVIVAQDQFGNTTSSGLPATLNITVSLSSGTGPLQGTTTLNIGTAGGSGTAAYTNLRIDVAGSGYQLLASPDSTFPNLLSAVFAVAPGPASTLVMAAQPSATATAGVPFAQQPVVLIQDAFGNRRSNDTLVVSARRLAGAGSLSGTTNVTAVSGVATFTDLAHLVATNITIQFTSGALTPASSAVVTITPAPFSQVQVLVPGEARVPGSPSGKTGIPSLEPVGSPFSVIVNAVDAFWNLTATNDLIHLSCSDSSATLPSDAPLNRGMLALNVTLNTAGTQTITASDASNPWIQANSSSPFVVAVPGPVLPLQTNQIINELGTLIVANAATETIFTTNPPVSGMVTNSFIFNYANRSALLADGWSYVATLPGGIPRNTEITNTGSGAVVSYNQSGALQIPCDLGDLWAESNNSRNSLFRALPTTWTSMRATIAFAPRIDFQQAHLMFYQDDDNYIQAGVAFNSSLGGEITTLVWEINGIDSHFITPMSLISSIRLRLDRDLSSGNITGYYSLNGTTWISLGTDNISLLNARLGFWVGGSPVAWTNGLPICSLQRIDVISTNTTLPVFTYQLVNPPAGASINGNGIISWTPSEAQGPGTNIITTIVTDSSQPPLSATNSFTVIVNEVNTAPVLPIQGNRVSIGRALVVVTNTATDSDIPVNRLTYQLMIAPIGASIDTNGVITWTPATNQVPSTNVFETVVTDYNPWAINAQHLSATNSFSVIVYDHIPTNDLVLPSQRGRNINELTTLFVTNTATGDIYASQTVTNSFVFNYSSRSSLLAAGWSYIATLPDGTARNTEITNTSAGAVVSYNQTTHPGTLWIPCDVGDLWANLNNTRNSLFRPLPTGWLRAQLSLSFAPRLSVEQAHLVMYQDDDNWVAAGLAYNNGLLTALDQETAGSPVTLSTAAFSGTNAQLRLDQDPGTGNITVLSSADGTNWTTLGQTSQALVNPRLCIWVGGSPVPYTNGLPNCILKRLDIISSNNVPSVLTYRLTNPPTGAAIDNNGVITWTPTEAQGPGTNIITTIVNDNGIPPLSDTNSFTIIVNEVNTQPLLPIQPDVVINAVTTLLVTNTATDLDIPPNPLSFQLLTAPPGATIDTNGIIMWPTSASQPTSTNLFVTVVTDYNPWAINNQHLSATNSFVVTVLPTTNVPPSLVFGYNPGSNTFQISFQGIPGNNYQVQWAPALDGSWTPLATVQADSNGVVQYQAGGPAATAFFRVLGL